MDEVSVDVEEGGHAVIVDDVIVPNFVVKGSAGIEGCGCGSSGASKGGCGGCECASLYTSDGKERCDGAGRGKHPGQLDCDIINPSQDLDLFAATIVDWYGVVG